MAKTKDTPGFLSISLGGKNAAQEKDWIERTAKKTGLSPARIVTEAVRQLMKTGLKINS